MNFQQGVVYKPCIGLQPCVENPFILTAAVGRLKNHSRMRKTQKTAFDSTRDDISIDTGIVFSVGTTLRPYLCVLETLASFGIRTKFREIPIMARMK